MSLTCSILILTGARGAGKTTVCARVVQEARARGWRVAGVLSPARMEQGEKTAIHVQDVCTQALRPLARPRTCTAPTPSVETQTWVFDENALAWGNQLLKDAAPCDLLVIDELGPLELEQGKGWNAGLEALEAKRYRFALVVVRPRLVKRAHARWPDAHVLDLSATPPGQLQCQIHSMLF